MPRHTLTTLLALASPALAQFPDVDPARKFSWHENTGWMNWRDANSTLEGARDRGTVLSGFVWCENTGWLNLGNGTPANGVNYSNASGPDFGVNINGATGNLTGYAWGENVGWVNFAGGSLAAPPQPARIDFPARRLRGYAWAENLGWINLDSATDPQFVALICFANCDASTTAPALNVADFSCFLNQFAAGCP